MRNYVKNKFKDRLTYCKDWKNSIELYLENKEISSKTNQEFYKSRPFLRIILDVYYLFIFIFCTTPKLSSKTVTDYGAVSNVPIQRSPL